MNADALFIGTLEDLETKLESDDCYEILMIAVPLRKLLLDSDPLVDQVNRNRKLRIKFTVNQTTPPPGEVLLWSAENTFDPNTCTPQNRNPVNVKRDKLLSCKVIKSGDYLITVKDFIKHAANVEGAIHLKESKNDKELILTAVKDILVINDEEFGLSLMKAIGRVVRDGLEPLKKQIEG